MNRRNFVKTAVSLSTIPLLGVVPSAASPKPIDKYDDPYYGNTFKTPYSVFTVREIEMMCRKMGWNHIEHFKRKWPDQAPQNYMCRCDSGYFDDKNGKEFMTTTTMRTTWWLISPYDKGSKEELMSSLTSTEDNGLVHYWYPCHGRRDYYFYDVTIQNIGKYDAWECKKLYPESPEPNEYAVRNHGRIIGHLILSHAGIGKIDGVLWSHAK